MSQPQRYKHLVTLLATAALTACGGGGGGGGGGMPLIGGLPAPAPSPAAPPDPSPSPSPAPAPSPAPTPTPAASGYAACVNEADWHEGTTLSQQIRVTLASGQTTTSETTVRTTGARQSFAGTNPVPWTTPLPNGDVSTTYTDLAGGNVIQYGFEAKTATQTNTGVYDPPPAWPMDMPQGQAVVRTWDTKMTITGSSGTSMVDQGTMKDEVTYLGQESVQTALGTFVACKVSAHMYLTSGGTTTDQGTAISWMAAEGPYRGQVLKGETRDSKGALLATNESVNMTYTPK